MSYHGLGRFNGFGAVLPDLRQTTQASPGGYVPVAPAPADTSPGGLWANLREHLAALAASMGMVADASKTLSLSEKSMLRGDSQRIKTIAQATGLKSGSWTAAQLATFRDARAAGFPTNMSVYLLKKAADGTGTGSFNAQVLDLANIVRTKWDSFVSAMGSQLSVSPAAPPPPPPLSTEERAAIDAARKEAWAQAAREKAASDAVAAERDQAAREQAARERAASEGSDRLPTESGYDLPDPGIPDWQRQMEESGGDLPVPVQPPLPPVDNGVPVYVWIGAGVLGVGLVGYLVMRKR